MNKSGKLNKYDMQTLNRAWGILSRWTEWAEANGMEEGDASGYQYDMAMSAVTGLCEFIAHYEIQNFNEWMEKQASKR